MQMQASIGTILDLATGDGMDANGVSAWEFTPTNDYPRLKQLNNDGSFGSLLPILATALDNELLAFTSTADSNNKAWFPQKVINNDGIDAIQSGTVIDNEKSCITTIVSGSSISFYWKVSSEPADGLGGDFCVFT